MKVIAHFSEIPVPTFKHPSLAAVGMFGSPSVCLSLLIKALCIDLLYFVVYTFDKKCPVEEVSTY